MVSSIVRFIVSITKKCKQLHHNIIFLFIGPSGSGKTTLSDYCANELQGKTVSSYTTRPKRYEGETGHVFITEDEFDQLGPLCAYTEYNGYRYGVDVKTIDASDFYVIDPAGAYEFLARYNGKKLPVIVWLECDPQDCAANMRIRGDTEEQIQERTTLDGHVFTEAAKQALCTAYNEKYHPKVLDGVYTLYANDHELVKAEALCMVTLYDTFYCISDQLATFQKAVRENTWSGVYTSSGK
jgi:guanylate kinase